jgi:hypothetical protein
MASAGRIESLLGLVKHTKFGNGKKKAPGTSETQKAIDSQTRRYRDFAVNVQQNRHGMISCEISLITQLLYHERNVRVCLESYIAKNNFNCSSDGPVKRWRWQISDERRIDDIASEIYSEIVSWYQ